MKLLKQYFFPIAILIITVLGFSLRFYHLLDSGVKFTDEGYCFTYAVAISNALTGDLKHFLYWYPALSFWVFLGCTIFGFSLKGALIWGAASGTMCIPVFYFFCKQIVSKRIALIGTLCLSFNYYLLFYARTTLPTGYGILFFIIFLACFGKLLRCSSCITSVMDAQSPVKMKLNKNALIAFTGFYLGILMHIRTDAGLIGFVMLVAAVIAVLSTFPKNDILTHKTQILKKLLPFMLVALYALFSFFLFIFIIDYIGWLNWPQAKRFFIERFGYTHSSNAIWAPYLFTIIFRLSSVPFLLISLFGLTNDVLHIKKLDMRRRWLLIGFALQVALFFKAGLSFPRAYVFIIIFMCFYWSVGIDEILSLRIIKNNWFNPFLLTALILATVFGEIKLIIPMLRNHSNYLAASDFIAEKPPGHLHGTHSWPLFTGLPFKFSKYLVYDSYKKFRNYKDFCIALRYSYDKLNIRYMILDNNISYFGGDSRMIQQFAVTVLPDAVFINDNGSDWHTCMDAFQSPPKKDMFTNRIMIYDMKNFNHIPATPLPFLGNEKMNQLFELRWLQKIESTTPKNK